MLQALYACYFCVMFIVASVLCASYLHAAYWRTRMPPVQILLMYTARLVFDIFNMHGTRRDLSYLSLVLVVESALASYLMHSNSTRAYDLFMYRVCVIACLLADCALMLSTFVAPESVCPRA